MTPLHILACGLCSPLGLDRRSTQLDLAAGADVFAETEVLDERGQPIRASRLELLPARASRTARMAGLVELAIDEVVAAARKLELTSLPIMLGLPEPDGGAAWRVDPIWRALLQRAGLGGVRLEPVTSVAAMPDGARHSGAAGLFQLLTIAQTLLDAGRDPLVIGAVDSRCDSSTLTELARARRLIDGGTEGYMPSEGAGFVLVTRQPGALGVRARPFTIVAHTHDHEQRSFAQREPSDALGLTRVLRRLRLGPPAISRVEFALSCQWDAGYWGRELVAAYLRNAELLPEPLRVELIAEQVGNPGAAGPLLQLGRALALAASQAKQTQQPARALIYGCAETGPLGACVIEAGPKSALLELPLVPSKPEHQPFETDRLIDHLELVGSLLVARADDIQGSIYPWPEVAVLEQRLNARFWAAGERARRVGPGVDALLEHDDPDVARACACLLLVTGSVDQRQRVLARMRELGDDLDALSLWRRALPYVLYGLDASVLVELLEPAEPPVCAPVVLAALAMLDELGLRPIEPALALSRDPEREPEVRHRALTLLAHTGAPAALHQIDAAWRAAPGDPKTIELMLTLGRHDVLDQLRLTLVQGGELSAATYEVWSLAAKPLDARAFAQLANRDSLELAHLWALSSFGSITAVPALLAALSQPTLALDAAIGLERILGAGLIGSVWIPDDDAEDPTRDGETRLRPVLDPARWQAVWSAHRDRFNTSGRYRHGQPLDDRARADELARPSSLLRMRQQAVRELAASRGQPVYFGFNWPIAAQQRALVQLRAWVDAG
jgi:3-oxoacyl-[acyl-carrier-protein] synthase I